MSPRSRGLGLGHCGLGQPVTAYERAFCYRQHSPQQTLAASTHADLVLQYEEGGRVRESQCPVEDGVCASVCVCVWGQGDFGENGSDTAVVMWEIWLRA